MAIENLAKIEQARASKQAAAAEFEARVQPQGTARREREDPKCAPSKVDLVPADRWAVVTQHQVAWVFTGNVYTKWVEACCEFLVGETRSAAEATAFLDRWDSLRDQDVDSVPPMGELFFYQHKAWRKEALDFIRTPAGTRPKVPAPSTAGMTQAAIVGSTEKWVARHAQLAAEAAQRPPQPDDDDDDDLPSWGPLATGSTR